MHHKKINFLKIFKIELEDLRDDIAFLIKMAEEDKEHGDISNYVFMGNLSVLKTEILGVNTFEDLIDAINPEDFEDLEDMVTYLEDKIAVEVKAKGLPESIFTLINRKLIKIVDYIEHTHTT